MMTLAVYRGDTLVQNVNLDGRSLRVGRLPENDLVLPDDGKAISKVHAELRMENGAYIVHDRGSTNGTWLDGQRVTRAALSIGHDVVIGPYRLVLSDDGVDGMLTPPTFMEPPRDYDSGEAAIPAGLTPGPSADTARYSGRAMGWLGRHRKALMFGGAAAALVFVAGMAAWQLSRPQPQAMPAPDPTTSLPEPVAPPPVVDPHATNINAATSIIDAAERAVAEGAFPGVIAQFERAVSEHLDPVLQVDPAHAEALLLRGRATDGIKRAQEAAAQAQAKQERNPKGPTQDEKFKTLQAIYPLEKRPDESMEEWSTRNEHALAENLAGLAQLKSGNCLEAKKTFSQLREREPSLVDVAKRVQEATELCRARGQAAITEGRQKEENGDLVGAEKDYATAKRYEHPDADRMLADNFNQRKKRSLDAISQAKVFAFRGNYPEALKQYEEVTRLLPASDKDHQLAAAQIEVLKRRQ